MNLNKKLKKIPCIIVMKIIYLLLSLVNCEKIIRNVNFPACKNCIHYKPSAYNTFASDLNKCEKFGDKNINTDKISYDYADTCREDETKCGIEGKYFEEEKNLNMKIATHKIRRTAPYIFLILLTLICYLPTAILFAIFKNF